MPEGWLDAVTDTTIWGRVSGADATGPVGLRVEVDGQPWGFARADHLDPDGGPWRFAIHHGLRPGQLVSVCAAGADGQLVLLEGSPRAVPAGAAPRGALEAVTATQVTGWAVDDDYDGPIGVALYVDGRFWRRVTADLEGHRFAVPHTLTPGQQVEAWAFGVRSDGSRDAQQVLLAGSPLSTPEGYLAPGVVHQAITDPAGPFAIHLVTVDLAAPSRITSPWPLTCSRAWRRPRRWPGAGGRPWPSTGTTSTPAGPAGRSTRSPPTGACSGPR
jgi:hypothetical protein